jgi:hypothetical protein
MKSREPEKHKRRSGNLKSWKVEAAPSKGEIGGEPIDPHRT